MRYRHALFLNPYATKASAASMSFFPPTGLEYVAASAKGLVDKLTLIDMRYEEELADTARLLDFIRREIDIICASITWNRDFDEACGFLNLMPDGIPIVVGGYKATEEVENIFKRCPKVSVIVRGEGEDTIKDIMNGSPPEKILGISYRSGGGVIHNANRALPDVNTIIPPDRKMRRNNYYMMLRNTRVTSATFDTILSSRGCPFNCKFCTFSLNPLGQKRNYSARSPESVVEEIGSMTAGIILFSDDNFFTEPGRSEEICDLIIKRGMKKRFVAQARIEVARHPRLLEKATRAGFKMLLLGIESPHDHILKGLNKGFNQEVIRKCFAVFRKYPIFYHGNYIYGNIGETEAEMLYIPKFSKEINLDTVAFSKLRADKFSPLRETIGKTAGYHLTDKGEVYSDTYPHARLKKIHRKLKFAFYTPLKMLQIVKKFLAVRFFTFSEVVSFVKASPFLLKNVVAKEISEKRFGNSMKLIFINGGGKRRDTVKAWFRWLRPTSG